MDLVISAVEINDQHGVGIFLKRLFPDSSNFMAIRSSTLYRGESGFGLAEFEFGKQPGSHRERLARLRNALGGRTIDRILVVPYYKEDFENGCLAKSLTAAPLCVYLMDDQNIFEPQVPDQSVFRLLKAADLRLAISQEMGLAYQEKFGLPFHVLPPVMTALPAELSPENVVPGTMCAALLGNIWRQDTFRLFRELVRSSGLRVDWFGNGPKASWLQANAVELETENIFCQGFLPDASLLQRLRDYPFMIVPSGSLGPDDPNPAFSRLSLPSRLVFGLVGAQIPILVLGSPETAAGRFVRLLKIGIVSAYQPADFVRAISYLMDPVNQRVCRESGRRIASRLVLEEGGAWIWRSLKHRKPATSQFSELFPLPACSSNRLGAILKYFAAGTLSLFRS
jgi:hypothetical protein